MTPARRAGKEEGEATEESEEGVEDGGR